MGCFPSKRPAATVAAAATANFPTSSPLSRRLRRLNPNPSETTRQAEKLTRLSTPGIMILIDAANLETEGQKLAWELQTGTPGLDPTWRIHYPNLLHLIARRRPNPTPSTARNIVAAHIISSEKQLIHQRYTPGRKTWARHGITFTIPSSRNISLPHHTPRHRRPSSPRPYRPEQHSATTREKAVDHTLVRIMTQEFEGLHLLHRNNPARPHRTFALVSGDFDYVDVVDQARLSGCDVEIWYWTGRNSLSNQWVREESRRHDSLGTLTFHDLREHFHYLTAVDDPADAATVLPGDRPDRLSFSSERSANDIPQQPTGLNLGGATGRRRFYNGPKSQKGGAGGTPADAMVSTPETGATPTASDFGAELGLPSPLGSAASSSRPSPAVHAVLYAEDDPSNERCKFREFCRQEACSQRHSEAERRHFALHGGKGRYRLAKTKPCKGGKLCKANEKRLGVCPFLHDGEEPLCVKCLQVHADRFCNVDRVRPINPLEARPLVKDGYLIDLLVAKGSVAKTE